MTNTTITKDIDELRDAIKSFIYYEMNSRKTRDKTSMINYCTAALIYFTKEGFTRDEIRSEVVEIVA